MNPGATRKHGHQIKTYISPRFSVKQRDPTTQPQTRSFPILKALHLSANTDFLVLLILFVNKSIKTQYQMVPHIRLGSELTNFYSEEAKTPFFTVSYLLA